MKEFWCLADVPAAAPALILSNGETIGYGRLDALAEAWTARLRELAGSTTPLVALEFVTTVDAIAAYLGALRSALPLLVVEPGQLDAGSPLRERWRPEICLTSRDHALAVTTTRDERAPYALPHPDLRLLLSTSGTTGDPKLVRLSGGNIASNARAIAAYLEITPADRAVTTLPLFYSYGLSVLNSYLAAGATIVLTERSITEPAFWREFADQAVTSLAFVPHQFELLERIGFDAMALPSLRYVTQAGGKLPADAVARHAAKGKAEGWRLFVMYGQTEAAPRIAYVPPEALPEAADTIGRAVPGGALWLADEEGYPIADAGLPGELVYRGPNVMMGYAEQRADLARGAELTELRTGDIAERTPAGLFRIVGRLKRFVKLFGLRISLDQTEALLRERGIVAQAVAVDDVLVLLYRDAGQGEAARAAVADAYDVPLASIHTGHMADPPLLASGKADQRAMRILAERALQAERDRAPRQGQGIAEIFLEATRSRTVAPGDSFTTLGGDSLSYLQVQMALEERFGAAPDGWEDMRLDDLEALPAVQAAADRRSPVGIDVFLRLAAIVLVIAQHASSYALFGGVWMLILVMGYSASRFQMRLIGDGDALRLGLRMLYPILPLYYLLLLVYGSFRKDVPASYLLLYANYQPAQHSLLEVYWFVSLYAQIVLVLIAVAASPPLRRALARRPWQTAMIAMICVLAVEVLLMPKQASGAHAALAFGLYARGLLPCLPVFLIGWMLQRQRGWTQTFMTLVLGAVAWGLAMRFQAPDEKTALVFGTILLLAIAPRIMLPAQLGRLLQQLASVTLFVYLLHEFVVFYLVQLAWPYPATMVVAVVLSFLIAFVAKAVFDLADRFIIDRLAPATRRRGAMLSP